MAFVIGWNMLLEYVIGTASVGKALSQYVDTIFGNAISKFLTKILWMDACLDLPGNAELCLSPYVDILAFALIIILTFVLCWGIKESAWLNNAMTLLTLVAISFVVIAGLFKLNFANWGISIDEAEKMTENDSACTNGTVQPIPCYGNGGFFPFGLEGAISGAATTFYAYVGFDIIATTG